MSSSDLSDGEGRKLSSPPALDDDILDTDDGDVGLFGSDSESSERPKRRKLDDRDLDSGDDEGRSDREASPMEEDEFGYGKTLRIMDLDLGRTAEPESSDGHIHIMTVPNFLAIESENFDPETYVAPPFSSASTSLCWRHDPTETSLAQSNARIIRWSDGSLTLQLASNPKEQYKILSNSLGCPNNGPRNYNDSELQKEAHTYLGAAAEVSSVIRLTSHLTSSLTVLPTTVETDDAVQKLQESLAAATRGAKRNPDGSVAIFEVKEDPELAKKQAEQAEREKIREAKRRQAAADRDIDRGRRVGVHTRTGGGGLTIAGLEGDEELGTTKARGMAKKPYRRQRRRDEIYSEDDDDYGRRRTREDEYDEDDGFLVPSDEEPEFEEGEDEEEEELVDDEDLDAEGEIDDEVQIPKPSERQVTPNQSKRSAVQEKEPEPASEGSPHQRKKHRYVVDDDEDE
ncbi:hypothetical protein FQN57_000891 [Myotisia sp. PD_48]|nr:hypothetical protein FQN57_000891 [Myotisia sp. PD_48]